MSFNFLVSFTDVFLGINIYLQNEFAFNCFTILIENNALRSTINEELTMQFSFIPKRHFAFSSKHTESTRGKRISPLFENHFHRLLLELIHKTSFFSSLDFVVLTHSRNESSCMKHFLFSMSEKREEEKASDEKAFT